MISNPDSIHYACIARATTILAHHTSNYQDPNIENLASQCLAQAPPNHSLFSHTVKNRTYTFLFDPPFIYFTIFDRRLLKSQALSFLRRIKSSFRQILLETASATDDFSPLCFQLQFDLIFPETVDFDSSLNNGDCRNPSVDSSVKGKRSAAVPLLGKPVEGLLKKKKRVAVGVEANGMIMDGGGGGKDALAMENKVDVCDDVNGCLRDFSVAVPKGMVNDRQKAKHIWKKHVWVVLLLDLFVCAVLFVIWLWVCSGFKCMAY